MVELGLFGLDSLCFEREKERELCIILLSLLCYGVFRFQHGVFARLHVVALVSTLAMNLADG